MLNHTSEVANFRHHLELTESSARLGLYGLAAVASHEAITRRMECGALRILGLLHQDREQEAVALMMSASWCQDDEQGRQQEQGVTSEQE